MSNVKKGDYVIVHAGFAIEKLNRKEAEKTLKIIKEI
ncbi:MAG: HypC/HybG/HupF family hydrogenase formation chaperone [bacterium]|nr:HypC/HybG/HupF family hydrogenase formation chaperone [bacterium]